MFAHHHLHTEYSPQDAPVGIKPLVKLSKQLGYKTVTVTDHGTVSSWVKLSLACKDEGLKPIFGLEAYFTPDRNVRETRDSNYHLILIAKTNEGLRNLFRLTEEAYRTGFYYSPRIDWQLLEQHGEGASEKLVFRGCLPPIQPLVQAAVALGLTKHGERVRS